MAEGGISISPSELTFRFELRKQIPVTLTLNNSGSTPVAFKVKTTSPKKYIVRPSTGVVMANSSFDVQVIMQAQKESPAELSNCKDKFLVQTVVLPEGQSELTPETFDKENAANIVDSKLKVVLVAPPAPPSPVPEGDEGCFEDAARAGEGAVGGAVDPSKYAAAVDDLAAATKELNSLKDQLKKVKDEKASLTEKMALLELRAEGKPALAPTPSGTVTTAPTSEGFTLIHLILVAFLCFLLGHFT